MRGDQGVLPGFLIVLVEASLLHNRLARNIEKAAASALIGAKKGASFSVINFYESFCRYYTSHNYVIPQAIQYAISQTHSAFYPHLLQGLLTTNVVNLGTNYIRRLNQLPYFIILVH